MTLDPSEIAAIVAGLAAALGPNILYGYIAAAGTSVLITLALTIPRGSAMVEKRMLDPNGKVQKARAVELANFRTEMAAVLTDKLAALKFPDAKAFADFEKKVDGVIAWSNGVTPLINNLTAESLQALISKGISDARKGAVAREGKEGRTTELEEVASIAGQAAEHPEAAMAYKGIMSVIDFAETMMQETPTNAKKIAKARAQAQSAFENGEDLIALRDQFSKMFPTAYANFAGGQAPSGGGAPGGRKSGPAQF